MVLAWLNDCIQLTDDATEAVKFINSIQFDEKDALNLSHSDEINNNNNKEKIAVNIGLLWKETAVQTIYDKRASKYVYSRIDDSMDYFFDNIERICSATYIPSDQDMILIHDRDFRRKGIAYEKFEIGNTIIIIILDIHLK